MSKTFPAVFNPENDFLLRWFFLICIRDVWRTVSFFYFLFHASFLPPRHTESSWKYVSAYTRCMCVCSMSLLLFYGSTITPIQRAYFFPSVNRLWNQISRKTQNNTSTDGTTKIIKCLRLKPFQNFVWCGRIMVYGHRSRMKKPKHKTSCPGVVYTAAGGRASGCCARLTLKMSSLCRACEVRLRFFYLFILLYRCFFSPFSMGIFNRYNIIIYVVFSAGRSRVMTI